MNCEMKVFKIIISNKINNYIIGLKIIKKYVTEWFLALKFVIKSNFSKIKTRIFSFTKNKSLKSFQQILLI